MFCGSDMYLCFNYMGYLNFPLLSVLKLLSHPITLSVSGLPYIFIQGAIKLS